MTTGASTSLCERMNEDIILNEIQHDKAVHLIQIYILIYVLIIKIK